MTSLYPAHLQTLLDRYQEALQRFHLDQIVLASGPKSYYFQDDHSHPFHAYAGAQQWLPFDLGADTFIVVSSHAQPTLIWPVADDFWHAANPVPAGDWQTLWNIKPTRQEDNWSGQIRGKTAWVGPEYNSLPGSFERRQDLLHWLNFQRAYKSPYEIAMLRLANQRALKGHDAAEQAFLAGKSELGIYLDYLAASEQTSAQEPYPGIVALNQHAAVLHYEHKATRAPDQSHTLLIDAGVNQYGYASDITRTFTTSTGLFSTLLDKMTSMQLTLCQQATAGVAFSGLHAQALIAIADILQDTGLCRLSSAEQIERGITQTFFPHGLGHLLGLQVHDVGGHQINAQGTLKKPDAQAPFLRLTRQLAENMVITIEPGLYFIPMLLDKMQQNIPNHGCDMALIDSLKCYGGIRIEDNILITDGASQNLTRN